MSKTTKKEIKINAGWLQGLVDVADKVNSAKDWQQEDSWTNHLLGYIESARYILKNYEKDH